jgi:hypothetical protein
MATTTNYGWTTPDDTALVKDGASAIRTLGSSVDTTTKNLNPETTLGDIAYRSSTSNVNTRLGIGSTGNVLTVAGGVPTWAAPATPASTGLVLISTQSFTTASSITFNDVFSSTYDNYRLVMFATNQSASLGIRLRYRVSATDASGSDYNTNGQYTYEISAGTTATLVAQHYSQTGAVIGDMGGGASDFCSIACDIFQPNKTEKTHHHTSTHRISQMFGGRLAGYHNLATSYTGFTLITTAGTITGSASIYGYAK